LFSFDFIGLNYKNIKIIFYHLEFYFYIVAFYYSNILTVLNAPGTLVNSEYFRSESLKTYIHGLKILNSDRLYRSVFERDELTYVYVDFSFFNKKFDEHDWDAEVEFVLYQIVNGISVLLDTTAYQIEVKTSQNKVLVSYNWGDTELGDSWDDGQYRFEAWINKELAECHDFYVQDFGMVAPGENPYFNVYALRMFESCNPPEVGAERNYMLCFRDDTSRFIYAELEIENRQQGNPWQGEFSFWFYNDARIPVGHLNVLVPVETNDINRLFRVEAGIGHNEQVSWLRDKYTVDVWFMGVKVATTAFEVDDKEVRGSTLLELPEKTNSQSGTGKPMDGDTPQILPGEEILSGLDDMVGLDEIRNRLKDYIAFVKYRQLLSSKGLDAGESINLHAVFKGNPGTGKTTVARTLGKIYHSLGLLPRDTVFEADRSTLIGRYIGETAPMTKDVIEKARGGILFIDEAYALSKKSDEKDFGREALEIILKEMSDGPGDLAVIVAGYPAEMDHFLDFNPGLRSRFQTVYEFPDYLPEELVEIAAKKAARKGLTIDPNAGYTLMRLIGEEYRNRNKSFGNARLVGSIIESAQINLGVRIMKNPNPESLSLETISTITKEDLDRISFKTGRKKCNIAVNEELLAESLSQLNNLSGISNIKQEIRDLIKLVRYHKEIDRDIMEAYSLHNIFLGNPGTGKTTVARLMAQIFKALGILERGHLVECNRENLVAGHVGQTATKTNNLINSAMGGVLFIDEAYSLASVPGSNDFGGEAIEVILKRMEDDRGRFAVIMAGYTQEMQRFLDMNPGLRSRIDNHMIFQDYSAAELYQIAFKMLTARNLYPTPEASQILESYFAFHCQHRDRFFGNARFARKVIDKACRNQLLRMGDLSPSQRIPEITQILTEQDVQEFQNTSDPLQNKPGLGFRR
jgi:SpoVK/Ycf46/Vps4 family AAA+-type ATPase